MAAGARAPIMLSMTRPASSSKVLLVKDRRSEQSESGASVVRRYRLARLRFDSRPAGTVSPYEYLKRVYD
jgi:hypothetical protein